MKVNELKGKMVAAGYTQRSLAREMNMSTTTLSKKVNGRAAFDTDEVVHLCDLLGIVTNDEKAYIFL